MAKETYFFRHDYNARNDHKTSALISDHGPAGYGIYWCIVEMLHEEETHKMPLKELTFRALAKQMSTDVEQVKKIVEDCSNVYELLTIQDEYIYSERVLRNIETRSQISESRSKAGKASAEKRKQASNSTSVEQVLTGAEQNPTKKRKRKEIKGKEIKEDIVKHFYRNNISLFEQEYSTLIEKYGKPKTEWMLDKLSSYKEANGKTYKSDYGAINTWVIDSAAKNFALPSVSVHPKRSLTIAEKNKMFHG